MAIEVLKGLEEYWRLRGEKELQGVNENAKRYFDRAQFKLAIVSSSSQAATINSVNELMDQLDRASLIALCRYVHAAACREVYKDKITLNKTMSAEEKKQATIEQLRIHFRNRPDLCRRFENNCWKLPDFQQITNE